MLVQVKWTNNRYDYVNDFMLRSLIEAGVVARFLRSSGWVTVGVDPVRTATPNREYRGSERRSTPSL
ncbi:GSU3473 family protein [Geoanaerobacter pelophilus]|uniref:GSU3473 family protein n=1 Tax=Geoanaerobacter pelophilus TaxID=60036 RepID=UPI000A27272B